MFSHKKSCSKENDYHAPHDRLGASGNTWFQWWIEESVVKLFDRRPPTSGWSDKKQKRRVSPSLNIKNACVSLARWFRNGLYNVVSAELATRHNKLHGNMQGKRRRWKVRDALIPHHRQSHLRSERASIQKYLSPNAPSRGMTSEGKIFLSNTAHNDPSSNSASKGEFAVVVFWTWKNTL